MIEREDRLPDWAFSDSEMEQMAIEVLEPDRYSEIETTVVFYHLLKAGVQTGLVLIAAVKSIIDGQEAIDRLWADVGITSIVGESSEESYLGQVRADAMYLLLQKYKYNGKIQLPGAKKVFVYQNFMAKLI